MPPPRVFVAGVVEEIGGRLVDPAVVDDESAEVNPGRFDDPFADEPPVVDAVLLPPLCDPDAPLEAGLLDPPVPDDAGPVAVGMALSVETVIVGRSD